MNPNAKVFVSKTSTTSTTLNATANVFIPEMESKTPECIDPHSQFVQIPTPTAYFQQVCQFTYKNYNLCIDWDKKNNRAILYGDIKYTWQCPDMPIRNIVDWWCECQVDYVFEIGDKSALDMLVSKAPLCTFDVEDTEDTEYDGILSCGCCDTCRCSLRERW